MPFPQVLINSRKRTAPPSAIAPDAKKKRIPGTDGTEAPQDPSADDHIIMADTGELVYLQSLAEDKMGLLLASRQLHAETADLPYKLGRFQFRFARATRKQWVPHVSLFMERRTARQVKAMGYFAVSPCAMVLKGFTKGTGSNWVKRLKLNNK
ncbi:hypothetical protein J4E91_006855 [Alternaria rosae]|nr:hypothetical protein J4E91_006855 [Alternaria rosae]